MEGYDLRNIIGVMLNAVNILSRSNISSVNEGRQTWPKLHNGKGTFFGKRDI